MTTNPPNAAWVAMPKKELDDLIKVVTEINNLTKPVLSQGLVWSLEAVQTRLSYVAEHHAEYNDAAGLA